MQQQLTKREILRWTMPFVGVRETSTPPFELVYIHSSTFRLLSFILLYYQVFIRMKSQVALKTMLNAGQKEKG